MSQYSTKPGHGRKKISSNQPFAASGVRRVGTQQSITSRTIHSEQKYSDAPRLNESLMKALREEIVRPAPVTMLGSAAPLSPRRGVGYNRTAGGKGRPRRRPVSLLSLVRARLP
jgi:hypothetical protein